MQKSDGNLPLASPNSNGSTSGVQPEPVFHVNQPTTRHHSCPRPLCLVRARTKTKAKTRAKTNINTNTRMTIIQMTLEKVSRDRRQFHDPAPAVQAARLPQHHCWKDFSQASHQRPNKDTYTSLYQPIMGIIPPEPTMHRVPERTTTSPGRRSSMQTTKPTKEKGCLGRNNLASINNHKMSEQIKKLVPGII